MNSMGWIYDFFGQIAAGSYVAIGAAILVFCALLYAALVLTRK